MGDTVVLILFALLPLALGVTILVFARGVRRARTAAGDGSGAGAGAGATKRGAGRFLLGNALVLLFLASLVLLGGELYYRFVYDTTDSFGLTRTSQRWFQRYYQMNNARVRDNIFRYPPRPEPGRRRVTFFGDSFTAGHGVADVDERFANLVRLQHPEWDVHVFATNGWDTRHETEFLQAIPDSPKGPYTVDIAVLVYCLNDISDILPEWRAILGRIYDRDPPGFFFEHSFFLNTLFYRFRMGSDPDLAKYYGFTKEAYAGEKFEEQKARLAEFREAVRARGGRLAVVTFPFLHELGEDYDYRQAHEKLDALWRSWDVPHLDLLEVYEGMDPGEITVNRFDAHPSRSAHALAADAIGTFLEGILSEPR